MDQMNSSVGTSPSPKDDTGGGTKERQVITHYGLFRHHVPNSPMIKEASFFRDQGGLTQDWGKDWEPIEDATSIGEARRKIAGKYGVTLSSIYLGEK